MSLWYIEKQRQLPYSHFFLESSWLCAGSTFMLWWWCPVPCGPVCIYTAEISMAFLHVLWMISCSPEVTWPAVRSTNFLTGWQNWVKWTSVYSGQQIYSDSPVITKTWPGLCGLITVIFVLCRNSGRLEQSIMTVRTVKSYCLPSQQMADLTLVKESTCALPNLSQIWVCNCFHSLQTMCAALTLMFQLHNCTVPCCQRS